VSFAKERMAEGLDPARAAEEAGFTRFRPVIMTAMAMIIAWCRWLSASVKAASRDAPLGRAVIGGLFLRRVATLFFVPAVY